MNYEQAVKVFDELFSQKLDDACIKKLLVKLYERGETAQEIAAAATVMRKYSTKLDISKSLQSKLIDVVGTGGDKSGSFNISTATSLLLSSAGSLVAKHGNSSVTSKSGSADVLEALNVNLTLPPKKQVIMLQECGFTFMHAKNHHNAMKYITPIRKSLNHRTIFNILGPLTNPAGAKKILLGVFNKHYVTLIANALKLNNISKAVVVSSNDGMDEIALSSISFAAVLNSNKIKTIEINPENFGFKLSPLEAVLGGTAKENAAIIEGVFDKRIEDAKRDIIILNTAVALWVDGKARDIKEGVQIAKDCIQGGLTAKHLKRIIEISWKLKSI